MQGPACWVSLGQGLFSLIQGLRGGVILFFCREAVISQKRLGCNGLGSISDLPGKPLAKLVAPLAPDTQGKGWELGRGKEKR